MNEKLVFVLKYFHVIWLSDGSIRVVRSSVKIFV